MHKYLSGRHNPENPTITEQKADPSLSRLTVAVNELSQLAEIPLFAAIERVLTDLGNATEHNSGNMEAVRTLRIWRAGYLRVIAELDAAARSLHRIEQELGQRIDATLAEWERRFGNVVAGTTERPESVTRRDRFRALRRTWQARESLAAMPDDWVREQYDVPLAHGLAPPQAESHDAYIVARVLGPLELSVAGVPIRRWGSLKARAIFQYLLTHQDRPVRREVLMELEWPHRSHNSARNNLNVALYSLRNTLDQKGLAARAIVHKEGCYLLNPTLTCWIDRNEFLTLIHTARHARQAGSTEQAVGACRSAVQLYRGMLFEDDLAGEWYLPERRQLEELNLQALEYLVETYCDHGQL